MTKLVSLLSLLVLTLYIAGTANSAATPSPAKASNFVKSSCSATTYPPLCVRTLSVYSSKIQNNPYQLALTALNVGLNTAQSAQTFVSKLAKFKGLKKREYGAIQDCLEEMGDSVDRLTKSVKEMKSMGKFRGQDFLWHMSNVQTWVSAALTDDNTCLDGFSGKALDGKIKTAIRSRVVNVAQVTSNALALCNKIAQKRA